MTDLADTARTSCRDCSSLRIGVRECVVPSGWELVVHHHTAPEARFPVLCGTGVLPLRFIHSVPEPVSTNEPASEFFVPVDCSHARGIQGSDFAPHPNSSTCLTSFRRPSPEIAQHTDESTWQWAEAHKRAG